MTGEQLKNARIKLDLTQHELAVKLDVTRVTISRWEQSDKIPEPQAKVVMMMLQYDTNEDVDNVTVNEPLSFIKNKNGLTYEELPNGKFQVEVPKVPYNAYASFIEVYGDEYAIKESFGTTIFTVDHPGKGNYISFTVRNDSMWNEKGYDTPSGAEVLGRELQKHHWKDGFNSWKYGWIIIAHSGMFHKDIEGPDKQGNIVCKSRNPSPEFPDFTMNLNDVHTIWKVIKRVF